MRYLFATGFVAALTLAIGCGGDEQLAPTQADLRPAANTFAITRLPSLGGNSFATAINDVQVIVGGSNGSPVKWTLESGSWRAQRLLGGSNGHATDVTEGGTIVGSSNGTAMLWPAAGGAAEPIGAGFPTSVNESEVVVGLREGQSNRAVAWTRSATNWTAHTLPRQAGVTTGFNEPSDINDDGVIVGYGQDASGTQHAIKWLPSTSNPGEWDPAIPIDAHAASTNSAALGIVGQDIVGLIWRCSTPTECTSREGYHWSLTGSGIGSLGSQDGWPEGLNSNRFIVGSFFLGGFTQHAFVWSPADPAIRDLGLLKGYQRAQAYDINTAKQAVGEMSKSRSQIAVVWTVP